MDGDIKAVILTGGDSRRMGFDKASIIYRHQTEVDRLVGIVADLGIDVFVSVANRRRDDLHLAPGRRDSLSGDLNSSMTRDPNPAPGGAVGHRRDPAPVGGRRMAGQLARLRGPEQPDSVNRPRAPGRRGPAPQDLIDPDHIAGPAAGICSAHDRYPDDPWLVLACDLPFVNHGTVARLVKRAAAAFAKGLGVDVVAYADQAGVVQPLCAVWRPRAMELVRRRAEAGVFSLRSAMRELAVATLRPAHALELFDCDTPGESAWAYTQLQTHDQEVFNE